MQTGHKNFLAQAFQQFTTLADQFNFYASLSLGERILAVHKEQKLAPRRIWTDLGIPTHQSETLSGHVSGMLNLLKTYGPCDFDLRETKTLIAVWAGPRVLAGEIPLHDMNYDDRKKLLAAAAALLYETDYFKIGRSDVLNDLCAEEDESSFVSDLDFVRTAMEAQRYKNSYPHLTGEMNAVIGGCYDALLTSAGKDIWKKAFESGSPAAICKKADFV